jgi:hypothetical protein
METVLNNEMHPCLLASVIFAHENSEASIVRKNQANSADGGKRFKKLEKGSIKIIFN